MGYESRIYVADKSDQNLLRNSSGEYYASVIARLNMSCCGDFRDIFQEESKCYIFADDGVTEITTDDYGKPLMEASLDTVISWLESAIKNGDDYRRFKVALALLKSFQSDQWDYANIVVLHYGY